MIIKNYNAVGKDNSRKKVLQIIDSGLLAIKTEKIIRNSVRLKKNNLLVKNKKLNLSKYKRVFVIGFGKASSLMAYELEKIREKHVEQRSYQDFSDSTTS